MTKVRNKNINNIQPNIIRGGQAIPLGNGFFYMKGRKHEQGGIDVGRDLEVEGDEIMQYTPKSVKVYSAQPILNGISPAQALLGGENPNKVFKAQETYKDRMNLNDDGTKKTRARLGIDTKKYEDNVEYRKAILKQVQAQQKTKQETARKARKIADSEAFAISINQLDKYEAGRLERIRKDQVSVDNVTKNVKELVRTVADNTPVIGDILAAKDMYEMLQNKDYAGASMLAGAYAVPFIGKELYKGFKGLAKSTKAAIKAQNAKTAYNVINRRNKNITNKVNKAIEKRFPGYKNTEDDLFLLQDLDDYVDDEIIKISSEHTDVNATKELTKRNLAKIRDNIDDFYATVIERKLGSDKTWIDRLDEITKGDTELKNFMLNNRDYATYCIMTGKNPKDNNTIKDFIKQQSTSIRGIVSPDEKTAIRALTTAYGRPRRGIRQGGDRLRTKGGLYTSNSSDIADRFSRPMDNNGDSYIGELLHNYEIDETLPIKEQLRELRRKNINLDAVGPWEGHDLKNKGIHSVEANYTNRRGNFEDSYERVYITPNNEEQVVDLINLDNRGNLENIGGRWGTKTSTYDDRYFLPTFLPEDDATIDLYNGIRSMYSENLVADELGNQLINDLYSKANKTKNQASNIILQANRNEHLAKSKLIEATREYDKVRPTLTGKDLGTVNFKPLFPALTFGPNQEILSSINPFNTNFINYAPNGKPKIFVEEELPFRYGGKIKTNMNKEKDKKAIGGIVRSSTSTGQRKKAELGINDRIINPFKVNDRYFSGDAKVSGSVTPTITVPTNINLSNIKTTDKPYVGPIISNNDSNSFWDKTKSFVSENLNDVIGAGANTIGSLIGWRLNKYHINRMQEPRVPITRRANKLKTTFNTRPQIAQTNEAVQTITDNINRNTSSSKNALNRTNLARINGINTLNNIYVQKENIETQLINQDKLNQQQVDNANVDRYNQYQDAVVAHNNNIRNMKSENDQALIAGINSTIQDSLARREKRAFDNTNILLTHLANPNVQNLMKNIGPRGIRKIIKDYNI